jgi:hypothetical protein
MHGSFSMSLLFSFTNSLVNTVMTQQILVSTNCLYKEHLESRGTFPSLSYRQDSVGIWLIALVSTHHLVLPRLKSRGLINIS